MPSRPPHERSSTKYGFKTDNMGSWDPMYTIVYIGELFSAQSALECTSFRWRRVPMYTPVHIKKSFFFLFSRSLEKMSL